jgi:hypothetical protein
MEFPIVSAPAGMSTMPEGMAPDVGSFTLSVSFACMAKYCITFQPKPGTGFVELQIPIRSTSPTLIASLLRS